MFFKHKQKLNLWWLSFFDAVGSLVYIFAVANIMFYGSQVFGKEQNIVAPVAFLLLFVVSASVVGSLVLGQPVYFYLEGKKIEAIKLLFCTIGFLALFTTLALLKLVLF